MDEDIKNYTDYDNTLKDIIDSWGGYNKSSPKKYTKEELCKEHLGGLDLETVQRVLKEKFPENFV